MKHTPPPEKPERKTIDFDFTQVGLAYFDYQNAKSLRDSDKSELNKHLQMVDRALTILARLIDLRSLVQDTYRPRDYYAPTMDHLDDAIFTMKFAIDELQRRKSKIKERLDQHKADARTAHKKLSEIASKGEEQ